MAGGLIDDLAGSNQTWDLVARAMIRYRGFSGEPGPEPGLPIGTPLVEVPTLLLLPVVDVAGGTPWPIGFANVEFDWVATGDEEPDEPIPDV